jgi:tRNA-dihydrouridine synthase A
MLQPDKVREIVNQMQRRTDKAVTVKCRIGVDEFDSYEELCHFIKTVASGGPRKFIIHARKCLLNGLTTKQNRDIPPLHYEVVHKLKRDFPELTFILNGGLKDFDTCQEHMRQWEFEGEILPELQGCMLGRQAYSTPLMFANADSRFFGAKDPGTTRRQILDRYLDYCDWVQSGNGPKCVMRGAKADRPPKLPATNALTQTMHSIFTGCEGSGRFKVALNNAYVRDRKLYNPTARDVIEEAVRLSISDRTLDMQVVGGGEFSKDDGTGGLGLYSPEERAAIARDFHDRDRARNERYKKPTPAVDAAAAAAAAAAADAAVAAANTKPATNTKSSATSASYHARSVAEGSEDEEQEGRSLPKRPRAGTADDGDKVD